MAGVASPGAPSLPPPTVVGETSTPDSRVASGRLGRLVPGLFAAITFGAATPVAKVVTDGISPAVAAGWLYLASGIALSVVLAVRRPRPSARVGRADLPWLLASVAIGGIAAPVAFFLGLARAPASVSSLLLGLELPLTVGIAVLLFRERLDRWRALGAALVTAGGILVVVLSSRKGAEDGGDLLGALWVGLACLGWAFDSNLMRFLAHRSPLDVARWKGLGGGLAGLGLAAAFGADCPVLTLRFVLGGAIVGIVAYGLSLAGYVASVRRLGAARTGMLFGTAPLFGLLGSAVFLHEGLGLSSLGPAALILAGVTLLGIERHPTSSGGGAAGG